MGELRVGAARTDITPKRPSHLCGYSGREEKSRGVGGRLHARAVVLESAGQKAALVSCELTFIAPEAIEAVRQTVCEPLGMPPEQAMICVTHTHAAPMADLRQEENSRVPTDLEWMATLEARIGEAILMAHARMKPARLGVARGASTIGCNRRETYEDGGVWLGHAWDKPLDRELAAVCL
ncbi:MAG: neutral/alkaline non-lysosomal ceramidase N-terminal domain-containing protein, partial [Candidatus Sumerlaeota bacterium]|nr:neutral/alkaline non-lysosomal ceramidase N-terminal domain-containing protein [Candidatus Sumerlaeota bacterium]